MGHLFPGGIFAWQFDHKPLSIMDYVRERVDVYFRRNSIESEGLG